MTIPMDAFLDAYNSRAVHGFNKWTVIRSLTDNMSAFEFEFVF